MLVLHATKFTDGQALASGLELLFTLLILFPGLQALCSTFVRRSNGPVACNVFFKLLVAMGVSGVSHEHRQGQSAEKHNVFFHGFT